MGGFRVAICGIILITSLSEVLTLARRNVRDVDDYNFELPESEEDYNVHEHDPGFLSPTPTPSEDPRHQQIWEGIKPKIREIVDTYERTCLNSGVYFDRATMEKELQLCFRPSIKQLLDVQTSMTEMERVTLIYAVEEIKSGGSLDSTGVDIIRKSFVEPLCHFTGQVLQCFKPHYGHVMERCATEAEGKAVEYSDLLVEAACRNNGSRIMDFLEHGGLECLNIYAVHGMECIGQNSKDIVNSPHLKARTTLELCDGLEQINGCLSSTIDKCPKKEPGKSLNAIFVELKEWTSNTCLKSCSSSISFTFSIFSMQTLIILLMSVLHAVA